jgi:hypothetical protein
MAIISFGCNSRYQLLLLGCILFFFLRELCFFYFPKENTKSINEVSMLFTLLIHISELIAGILGIINRKKSKKKKINSQDSSSKSYLYSTK